MGTKSQHRGVVPLAVFRTGTEEGASRDQESAEGFQGAGDLPSLSLGGASNEGSFVMILSAALLCFVFFPLSVCTY